MIFAPPHEADANVDVDGVTNLEGHIKTMEKVKQATINRGKKNDLFGRRMVDLAREARTMGAI